MQVKKCDKKMEVYSRVVGYYRPVEYWNKGKKEEYKKRKTFKVDNNKEQCRKEDSISALDY